MGEVLQFPIEQLEAKEVEQPKQQPQQPKKKQPRKKVDDFNALGHLVIGTLVGLAVAPNPVGLMLVLFGSLLPDIDHQRSTLGKYNPINRTKAMKHRGHCHSLIGVSLLSLPFLLLGFDMYLLVLYGALSHLLGDKLISFFPRRKSFQLKLW